MIELNTKELQTKLKVMLLGAGLNPIKPMTHLLFMKSNLGVLSFMTTDSIDTLYTTIACEGDLEIAVEVTQFIKLIQSLKTETLQLEIKKDLLIVKATGEYRFPAVLNSQGEIIQYKDNRKYFDGVIIENHFNEVSKTLKHSKADNLFPIECYRNIYFGDNILSTNTITASRLNKKVFDTPRLLNERAISILGQMKETIKYHENHFTDGEFYLITSHNKNIEDYQYDAVNQLFKEETTFIIDVEELKEIVARFTLFKEEDMIIKHKEICSVRNNIIEKVETLLCEKEVEIKVDVALFKKFISTFKGDIEMQVQNEFIILSQNQLSHIITKKV